MKFLDDILVKADILTDGVFNSTYTAGSPFSVVSNILNVNLNSDYLDGEHGSFYLNRANHTGFQAISTITGLEDALETADNRWISGFTSVTDLDSTVSSGIRYWVDSSLNKPESYGTVLTFVGVTNTGNPVDGSWTSQIMSGTSGNWFVRRGSGHSSTTATWESTYQLWSTKHFLASDIANWNTAFGWGSPSSYGFITASSANVLTNKSGNISQWTNDVGYLTSSGVSGFVSGSGSIGTIPYFSGTKILSDSSLSQDSSFVTSSKNFRAGYTGSGYYNAFESGVAFGAYTISNPDATRGYRFIYDANNDQMDIVTLNVGPASLMRFHANKSISIYASTGVSPLNVASTTLVTNLNSDLLDGYHASYLLSRSNHTGSQAWSTITATPTTLSGYGITDAATSTSLSGYVQIATPNTISADHNFIGTALRLSPHFFHNLYDGVNAYEHYYPNSGGNGSVSTAAQLRVWDGPGATLKTLRFGGDGSFTWDGNNIATQPWVASNFTAITRLISTGTGLTGGGSLSVDRTISVDFGTGVNQVPRGDDSRINNGQTAYGWGNHASAGYLTSGSLSTSLSGYVQIATPNTISAAHLFSGEITLPGSMFKSTYDGSNSYMHFYQSGGNGSTNSFANIRVWVGSGATFKTLRFGGDGSFVWDGNEIATQSYVTSRGYISSINSSMVTTALGYTPYNSSNPNGYITGINSSMVTSALGFTPYNASNPNGYINGINSAMISIALGYAPYSASNPNGYITSSALYGYATTSDRDFLQGQINTITNYTITINGDTRNVRDNPSFSISTGGGGITGSGSSAMMPLWNGSTSLTNSFIYNGTNFLSQREVIIGDSGTMANLIVQGQLNIRAMTASERSSLSVAYTGAMVYQTDGTEGLYMRKSSGWTYVG